MFQTTVPIKGMHCRSCELLIEDELSDIKGVTKVEVSHTKGCAVLYHKGDSLKSNEIESAVQRAGYTIGIAEKKPWVNFDPEVVIDVFYSIIAIGVLYLFVKIFGLDGAFAASPGKPSNLFAVLLIGITAGLSTCMALIGGLVLGVSARFSEEHPNASDLERFRPHLFFNAGRIASYAVLGGLIGILGSVFQLSGLMLGVLTIGVAGVMLLLGFQLTGLFPRLEDYKLALPAGLARALGISTKAGDSYSDKQAMIMGASTFFLPCGFTQAMQLYAMSSGSFVTGALTMAVFAIGTAPGLLGIGGLTAVLKGIYAQKFFRFAGIVVALLGFYNLNNGLTLAGWNPIQPQAAATASAQGIGAGSIEREGDKQVIRMTQDSSGYSPKKLTVVKGIPVKWIVTSTDQYSCAAGINLKQFGIRKNLREGENIIEFTPDQAGTFTFTCMMGMHRGTIEVVESESQVRNPLVGQVAAAETEDTQAPVGSCGSSGGCGCGGGAQRDTGPQEVQPAQLVSGVQVLKSTYTVDTDISPREFSVEVGKPVSLEIDVKEDGYGCMSSVMIPGVTAPQLLEAGKQLKLEFTPQEKGDVFVTCAMGMTRGIIRVN